MQSLISIVHQDFQLIGKCKRIRFKKTLKLPRARRSNGRARPWGGHSGGGGGAISVIFLLGGCRCSLERSYCTCEAIIWITLVCTNVTRLERTSQNAEEIRSQGTWSHKKQSNLVIQSMVGAQTEIENSLQHLCYVADPNGAKHSW